MTQVCSERVTIELPPARPSDAADELEELRRGLLGRPREIPSKYFYDDRGSALFERICELPEYYQTRTEHRLLAKLAPHIVADTGARELVEIGAGAATKTRVLLDAMQAAGQLRRYLPLDVSEGTLRRLADELIAEYAGLSVHGVVGDFSRHLDNLPAGSQRLVIFLGGTIGNLRPSPEAAELLRDIAGQMAADDHFLLGIDLIKDRTVLEAAYNDRAGVTAEFNRNILAVINHRFGADFDPAAFRHLAFYAEAEHRIEMWLRASRRQRVRVDALELEIELEVGEEIRTEISTKYDQAKVEALLSASGLKPLGFFADAAARFALVLARKAS